MKSTEHFIILEYPQLIISQMIKENKLCLWEDVYKELGLFYIFETYNLNITKDEDRFNYHFIRMSKSTLDNIEDMLKINLLKSTRKDIKFYNREGRLKKFSWNSFYCAPYTNSDETNTIEGLEVWIPRHPIAIEDIKKLMKA